MPFPWSAEIGPTAFPLVHSAGGSGRVPVHGGSGRWTDTNTAAFIGRSDDGRSRLAESRETR